MKKKFTPHYDLHFTPPCGGYITLDGDDTGAFLQGDDYYSLEAELESLWKQVIHKKTGQQKACDLQDSILSDYVED